MQDTNVAFNILAAGVIHPREGFKYTFENGADFVCAGLFGFQIRENVMIAKDILSKVKTFLWPDLMERIYY